MLIILAQIATGNRNFLYLTIHINITFVLYYEIQLYFDFKFKWYLFIPKSIIYFKNSNFYNFDYTLASHMQFFTYILNLLKNGSFSEGSLTFHILLRLNAIYNKSLDSW